eukprot:scaffold40572_cov63-Phaeocystis_antarctica.AAC.1
MSVPEKNLRFCAGEGQQPVSSKASSKKRGAGRHTSEDEEPASDELQIKTQQAFVLANHGNLDVFVHGMRLGTCDKDSPTSQECECAFNGFVLPRCLRNATIRPGETLRVPVTFESDFSTSLATTKLTVLSSAGPLEFKLQAQLPHHLLPMCRAQLQLRTRPSEAEQRSRTIVTALLLIALLALGQTTLKEVRLNRSVIIRLVSCRHSVPAEATLSEPGAPSTEVPLGESSSQGKPVAPARPVRAPVPPGSSTGSEDGRDSPELHAATVNSALTNGAAAREVVAVVLTRDAPPEPEAKPPPAKLTTAVPTVPAAAKPKAGSPAAHVAAAAQAVLTAPLEPAAPAPIPASSHAPPSAAQTPAAPVAQLGVGPGPNASAVRARSKAAAEAAAAAAAAAEAAQGAPPPPAKPELLHRTSSSSSTRSVEAGETTARRGSDASDVAAEGLARPDKGQARRGGGGALPIARAAGGGGEGRGGQGGGGGAGAARGGAAGGEAAAGEGARGAAREARAGAAARARAAGRAQDLPGGAQAAAAGAAAGEEPGAGPGAGAGTRSGAGPGAGGDAGSGAGAGGSAGGDAGAGAGAGGRRGAGAARHSDCEHGPGQVGPLVGGALERGRLLWPRGGRTFAVAAEERRVHHGTAGARD